MSTSIDSLKAAGNAAFAKGNIEDAIGSYTDAIKAIKKAVKAALKEDGEGAKPAKATTATTSAAAAGNDGGEAEAAAMAAAEEALERAKKEGLLVHPDTAALYSNRSACFIKLEHFEDGLEDALVAIEAKPAWWKGYARAAQAKEGLELYADAEGFVKRALEVEPANDEMKAMLKKLGAIIAGQAKDQSKGITKSASAASASSSSSKSKNNKKPDVSGIEKDRLTRVSIGMGPLSPFTKRLSPQALKQAAAEPAVLYAGWRALLEYEEPIPTAGCRKGLKLTTRPPAIDGRPSSEHGPMFFPAVPQWPLGAQLESALYAEAMAGARKGNGRPLVKSGEPGCPYFYSDIQMNSHVMMLSRLSGGMWVNQRTADLNFRRSNKIPAVCDFCSVDLSAFKENGPCCECGEQYCSRLCLELDYADHSKMCATIRSQSEGCSMLHQMYWEGVVYNDLKWEGAIVPNYSIKYRVERYDTNKPNDWAVLCKTCEVRAPKTEKDVAVDELSYLMKFERTAVTQKTVELQANLRKLSAALPQEKITQKANATAAERKARYEFDIAQEAMYACVLQLHLQYANYNPLVDSPARGCFKWLMAQMLYMNVLVPMRLSSCVEPFDEVTSKRFDGCFDAMKKTPLGMKSFMANVSTMKMV